MRGPYRLEDSEKLNGFISRQLRKAVSDDSIEVDMLRDYVDLLLKRDEDISSLKSSCKSELGEFLKEGTENFVNMLFQAIKRGDFEIKQVGGSSAASGGQRSGPSHSDGYHNDEDGDGRKRGREDDDSYYGSAAAANLYGNSNDTYYGHSQHDKRSRLYEESWRGRGRGSFVDRGGRGHYDRGRGSYGRGYSIRGGRGNWNAGRYPPTDQNYGQYGDWSGAMDDGSGMQQYNSGDHLVNDSYSTSQIDGAAGSGDQCTLKCAEIPNYIKEQDLLKHFYKFGRVVNSRRVDAGVLLVQYSSSHEALKCFHSPQAVLNNRFIQLNINDTNIEDPMTAVGDKKYRGHSAGPNRDKSKNYYSKEGGEDMVGTADTIANNTISATTPSEKPQVSVVDTAEELDYGLDDDDDDDKGAATSVKETPKTPQTSSSVKSEGSAVASDSTPADAIENGIDVPVHVLTQEDIELKKQHAEAKKLKEQRESIHKTKENILQVSPILSTQYDIFA